MNCAEAPVLTVNFSCWARYHFGRPGTGRISIGLYVAFLHKWLSLFPRNQLLAVRLEDFNVDPKAHISKVRPSLDGAFPTAVSDEVKIMVNGVFRTAASFDHSLCARQVLEFLELQTSEADWEEILVDKTFNEHRAARRDILPESQELLRDFHQPFNERLVKLLLPGGAGSLGVNNGNGAGDPLAARFSWDDAHLTHSASKPVMRSQWNSVSSEGEEEGGRGGHLPAHQVHDPRSLGTVHRESPTGAAPLGDGGEQGLNSPNHPEGGRDGLPWMPEEMASKNG